MATLRVPLIIRFTVLWSTSVARISAVPWRVLLPANQQIVKQKKYFHVKSAVFKPEPIQSSTGRSPPVDAIRISSSTAQNQPNSDDAKHAAFLGEADSNDGHDAFRDAHAKRHEAMDGSNSAFLGEGDSNDGDEIQRDIDGRPLPPLDAKRASFLGEADSDDAFDMDVIENPEAHEHQVGPEEAKNAAFLGEADSADMMEADREVHPEDYSHRIEDTSTSGMHGETGQHDQ